MRELIKTTIMLSISTLNIYNGVELVELHLKFVSLAVGITAGLLTIIYTIQKIIKNGRKNRTGYYR